MPGMTTEQEQQILDKNRREAESVETSTETKPPEPPASPPVLLTLKAAYRLSDIPKSSFDLRRKEGHFRTYQLGKGRSLRLKYQEFIDDCLNLASGGKPNHEPDKFLPPRRRDA